MNYVDIAGQQPVSENRDDARGTPDQGAQWAWLGLLRFGLASIVVCSHIDSTFYAWRMADTPFKPVAWLDSFAAVIGFFFVSGYCIAHSLSKSEDSFFRRRLARLAPVYLTGYLIAVYVMLHPGGEWIPAEYRHVTASTYVLNLLFLQGIVTYPLYYFNPSWSLGSEAWYYAFAPRLNSLSKPVLLGIAAVSAGLFATHRFWSSTPFWYEIHFIPTFSLAWAWIVGFVAYKIKSKRGLISLSIVATAVGCSTPTNLLPLTWLTLAMSITIVAFCRWWKNPIGAATMIYAGEISYPLYLTHYAMIFILFHQPWYGALLEPHPWLMVAACLAVAVTVRELIEIPLHRLLHYRCSSDKASGTGS